MNYSEALKIIHRTDWKGSKLGLERICALLKGIGDPQKKDSLRVIHVAGTNGKGSVSSMLCSSLTRAGYRTGLFTSPFLVDFRERIRIGDALISKEDLCRGMEALLPVIDAMEDAPTEFEILTALAFWYYQKEKCDLVVCEVGLGGEFDATNVIERPLLSIITSIGMDHTEVLGDTIEQIAAAKAGIIKKNCPVLFGEGTENEPALKVIRARAQALDAPLYLTDPDKLSIGSMSLSGTRFSYRDHPFELTLCGAYQPKNAMTALDALAILRENGLEIPLSAIREGLGQTRWIGRFEVLCTEDPVFIIDGAHNESGARALKQSLDACFPASERFCAVLAVMADKDYRAMLKTVAPRLARVFAVAPEHTPRALDAQKLAAVCGEEGICASACETAEQGVCEAIACARQGKMPVLVFGSLYLYRQAQSAALRYLRS